MAKKSIIKLAHSPRPEKKSLTRFINATNAGTLVARNTFSMPKISLLILAPLRQRKKRREKLGAKPQSYGIAMSNLDVITSADTVNAKRAE